jgi:hypothetical protein
MLRLAVFVVAGLAVRKQEIITEGSGPIAVEIL